MGPPPPPQYTRNSALHAGLPTYQGSQSVWKTGKIECHLTTEDNIIYYNIDNIHKLTNQNNSQQFSCLHLNIHSLPSKFDALISLLETTEANNTKVDFICLCETFLSDQNTAHYSIPGYNIIANNRNSKSRGGVAIYIL